MKKTAIIYGELKNGVQKKALEQLSQLILEATLEYPVCIGYDDYRENGEFRCIYIGTKAGNPYIKSHSTAILTKAEEYFIKVFNDTVMIEGFDDAGVLYGCMDFYNKYIVKFENTDDAARFFRNVFDDALPDFEYTSAPSVKNRGIWTWGHVIYDYKSFIDNMVKLKMNTVIIWNDFVPLNAREMIAYAHDCAIKVIWGFSWLWDTSDAGVDIQRIYENIDGIVEKYEKEYRTLGGDGIYFQSFTEFKEEKIGDTLIAEAVTDFVNKTAERFFALDEDLILQFGLHATSVKEKLGYIQRVNPKIQIIWEDCGAFPFAYMPCDIKEYNETAELVKKIAHLRGQGEQFGVVTKGFVNLDWGEFKHLKGAFYIGKASKALIKNRVERKSRMWKYIQAYWLANADKAYDMVKLMCDERKGDLYICPLVEDGMFEENIMYPVALYSEMLWDCGSDIKQLMSSVALRSYVDFA